MFFFNQPPGDGECIMDPKQVNVLNLPPRPGLVEAPIEYLSAASTLSDIEEVDTVENEVDVGPDSSGRRKRSPAAPKDLVLLPEAITDNEGKTRHVVTLDCDRGTAKCFKFRCNIRNLQRKQSAVIKVRAR